MPATDDSDATDRPPTTAAYDLPELRRAMRAGAKGIKGLMQRVGFREEFYDLLPASYGADLDMIAALLRETNQPGEGRALSAEQLTNESMIQYTIDHCLSHFHPQTFVPGKVSALGFSQRLFGMKAFFHHAATGLEAYSVWVCDQFIGAKSLRGVLGAAASDGCLTLKEDQPVTAHEKKVFRHLKAATTGSMTRTDAHFRIIREFLKLELEFLREVQDRVEANQPVTSVEAKRLGSFLSLGSVQAKPQLAPGGPWGFDLLFVPSSSSDLPLAYQPIQWHIARLLAAPVAFQICLKLAELSRSPGRKPIIQQCHAPSCGKLFFTARAHAVACKSREEGRPSPCKLEWDKFKLWLKNRRHDPNTEWNTPRLIKWFKSGT